MVDAVRKWERSESEFDAQFDPGRQHEVLTPSMPRNRILATWQLDKQQGIGGSEFVLSAVTRHEGNFAAVMPLYVEIASKFAVGETYDSVVRGNEIDRIVLL